MIQGWKDKLYFLSLKRNIQGQGAKLNLSLSVDSDFWKSPLAAAKLQYNLQHHHQSFHMDCLSMDDSEAEDELRPDFPCPYCCEDFDIVSLFSHLEVEHARESNVTICPVCCIEVPRDMLSHITQQHEHLFKRRRRLRIVGISKNQVLSLVGLDIREALQQVLLGGGAYGSSNSNVSNAATDSFLHSIISNFPASEAEEITKSVVTSVEDTAAEKLARVNMWKSSFDPSLSYEEQEKSIRQATGRARFIQDLLLSTLLND